MAIKFLSTVAVDTNVLYVNAAANKVGIGTTAPQEKLDISAGDIRLDDNFSINWASNDANIGRVRIVGNEANDFLQFVTDNSERMRLTNTGLGIGTTSPDFKLDVDGDIRIEEKHFLLFGGVSAQDPNWIMQNTQSADFSISEGMSGVRFFIENGGNVGIGTTTPNAKLDVNGGVKVANDTDTAGIDKVGTLRYRYVPGSPKNFSYVDMCMQTGGNSYAWVNIVQNVWN
jgi:hypothetical protein